MMPTAQNQIIPQMEFIRDTLLALVGAPPYQGDCVMVSNLKEMWELASNDSQKPLVYICYGGETPWSSNTNISAVTYRVDRKWIVGVKQGRGYSADRGKTLENILPFVEEVRDTLRAMLGISEQIGNDFAGIEPWSQGSMVIDGYILRFSTKNNCPPILPQPDE